MKGIQQEEYRSAMERCESWHCVCVPTISCLFAPGWLLFMWLPSMIPSLVVWLFVSLQSELLPLAARMHVTCLCMPCSPASRPPGRSAVRLLASRQGRFDGRLFGGGEASALAMCPWCSWPCVRWTRPFVKAPQASTPHGSSHKQRSATTALTHRTSGKQAGVLGVIFSALQVGMQVEWLCGGGGGGSCQRLGRQGASSKLHTGSGWELLGVVPSWWAG